MKLVFIYGPPSVGKLTVATQLAAHTGFHLFHNQLTVLPVKALFPERGLTRTKLQQSIRLELITAAAEAGRDVIFTMAYSGKIDDHFVGEIVRAVERYDGEVYFVQLSAPVETLMERVGSESRKDMQKISDPEHLRTLIAEPGHDLFATVPYAHVLRIDTAISSPDEAAEHIAQNFALRG